MKFLDLSQQYYHMKDRLNHRIQRVLAHGEFIMGPEVRELERNLEDYLDVEHAITCANGTDALVIALMALGIKKGDIVFCPTFTFYATAESIAFVGATPVFVDSDDTYNICPVDLERRIDGAISNGTGTPKAIICVDLFGLPADYNAIRVIADKFQLKVVEDAAQGFGGSIIDHKGVARKAGTFGDISTTSFFPAKPLGCYGDGGAIFTDDDALANLARSIRVHGKGETKYDNVRIGMNSRLDTIQAAILIEKLEEFPRELEARTQLAAEYSRILSEQFSLPIVPTGYQSSWAQYTVTTKNRDAVIHELEKHGIPTAIYYEKCMHQQAVFQPLGWSDSDYPVASKHAKTVLSFPINPYLNIRSLPFPKKFTNRG